jgi:hypothetical protein
LGAPALPALYREPKEECYEGRENQMDQQQQRRVNRAAEEFASAVKESYRAVSERGQTAYELNAQLTEQFFNRVVENLRTQTEANRQAGQELAEQAQRGQEASRQLAQESLSAYTDFLNSAFSFAQAGPQAAKKSVREGGEDAQRISSREPERHHREDGESTEEDRRSLKEELRGIVRESVQRSEAGIGEEPQEAQEDGGTVASEGGRAAGQGPPIEGYDSMNVEQISNRLGGLSVEELEQLRRYEAANKDRSTLHRRIDNLIASSNT